MASPAAGLCLIWPPFLLSKAPQCEVDAQVVWYNHHYRFNMPSSFRVPALFRSRRSFNRLRSFHLSPVEAAANLRLATVQASMGGTNSLSIRKKSHPIPANLVIPLRGSTIVTMAIMASLFFIISISLAFLGGDIEDPYFKTTLDHVAETSPGVCYKYDIRVYTRICSYIAR